MSFNDRSLVSLECLSEKIKSAIGPVAEPQKKTREIFLLTDKARELLENEEEDSNERRNLYAISLWAQMVCWPGPGNPAPWFRNSLVMSVKTAALGLPGNSTKFLEPCLNFIATKISRGTIQASEFAPTQGARLRSGLDDIEQKFGCDSIPHSLRNFVAETPTTQIVQKLNVLRTHVADCNEALEPILAKIAEIAVSDQNNQSDNREALYHFHQKILEQLKKQDSTVMKKRHFEALEYISRLRFDISSSLFDGESPEKTKFRILDDLRDYLRVLVNTYQTSKIEELVNQIIGIVNNCVQWIKDAKNHSQEHHNQGQLANASVNCAFICLTLNEHTSNYETLTNLADESLQEARKVYEKVGDRIHPKKKYEFHDTEARFYRLVNNPSKATESLEKAIKLAEHDSQLRNSDRLFGLLLTLARISYRSNTSEEEAQSLTKQACEVVGEQDPNDHQVVDPVHAKAHQMIGHLHLTNEDWGKSLVQGKFCLLATKSTSNTSEINRLNLAWAIYCIVKSYLELGKKKEAQEAYIDNSSILETHEKLRPLAALAQKTPSLNEQFCQALEEAMANGSVPSISDLDPLTLVDPEKFKQYCQSTGKLIEAGKAEECVEEISKIVNLRKILGIINDRQLFYLTLLNASAMRLTGKNGAAISVLNKVLQSDDSQSPKSRAIVFSKIAQCHEANREWGKAATHYTQALKREPHSLSLAGFFRTLARYKPSNWEDLLDQLLSHSDNNLKTHLSGAVVREFSQMLQELDPDFSWTLQKLLQQTVPETILRLTPKICEPSLDTSFRHKIANKILDSINKDSIPHLRQLGMRLCILSFALDDPKVFEKYLQCLVNSCAEIKPEEASILGSSRESSLMTLLWAYTEEVRKRLADDTDSVPKIHSLLQGDDAGSVLPPNWDPARGLLPIRNVVAVMSRRLSDLGVSIKLNESIKGYIALTDALLLRNKFEEDILNLFFSGSVFKGTSVTAIEFYLQQTQLAIRISLDWRTLRPDETNLIETILKYLCQKIEEESDSIKPHPENEEIVILADTMISSKHRHIKTTLIECDDFLDSTQRDTLEGGKIDNEFFIKLYDKTPDEALNTETLQQILIHRLHQDYGLCLAHILRLNDSADTDPLSHPAFELHSFKRKLQRDGWRNLTPDQQQDLDEDFHRAYRAMVTGYLGRISQTTSVNHWSCAPLVKQLKELITQGADRKRFDDFNEQQQEYYCQISPIHLRKILSSVLENALTYSQPESPINVNFNVIDIQDDEHDRRFVEVEIRSTPNKVGEIENRSGKGNQIASRLVERCGGFWYSPKEDTEAYIQEFNLPLLQ